MKFTDEVRRDAIKASEKYKKVIIEQFYKVAEKIGVNHGDAILLAAPIAIVNSYIPNYDGNSIKTTSFIVDSFTITNDGKIMLFSDGTPVVTSDELNPSKLYKLLHEFLITVKRDNNI